MDAATLYLIYVAAAGGPERRVVKHYHDEKECREVLARWERGAPGRYTIKQGGCLTAAEYNAKVGIFTTDKLSEDRRL